jgi:hypothetical protein
MKQLVQPAAVIPSHAEEQVTNNGIVNPDSRMAQFIQLLGDITPVPIGPSDHFHTLKTLGVARL